MATMILVKFAPNIPVPGDVQMVQFKPLENSERHTLYYFFKLNQDLSLIKKLSKCNLYFKELQCHSLQGRNIGVDYYPLRGTGSVVYIAYSEL